jgi:pSer/pThr/pTyr-binding forkhead associated (FHA) protein
MAAPGQQGYVPQPPAPPVYTPPAPPAYVPPEQAYPPQPVQPQWQAPASYTVTGSFKVVATGASIPIPVGKTEILIGREDPVSGNFPDVDLDPHDGLNQGVSRQHCKLSMQGSQLVVEDLNAVNKTHLRGQQLIPGQKVPLNAGDELVLGRLRLVYYS